MHDITPLDFDKLSEEENKLQTSLGLENNQKNQLQEPSQLSVNNILAYSKALSVRPSDAMGNIENVLN